MNEVILVDYFQTPLRKKAENGYNAEFSHRQEDCIFETLLKSFGLKDSALVHIAQIVHDIVLKCGKFNRKEVEGINQITGKQ